MSAALWSAAGTLWRWRGFILGVTAFVAVAAVVITLMLPNQYRATARVVVPDAGSSGLGGLLGGLAGGVKGILGGNTTDYTRLLAILYSRTFLEEAVEAYDLVAVYDLTDSDTPLDDAVRELASRAAFEVDGKYEFLSISVLDESPQRASDLANYFVERLNERNETLSVETAQLFRAYAEQRYDEAQDTWAALLDSMQALQRQYGVYDLGAQTSAYFDQVAQIRAAGMEAEIEYEALRESLGDENPRVAQARSVVQASRRQYRSALDGYEAVLPVSQSEAPELVRTWADIELQRLIQENVLEAIAPLLEQARFDERRQRQAVQVLDMAAPPNKKAEPRRSVLCIVATLSAFVLAVLFVLFYTWVRSAYPAFRHRLLEASRPAA